MTARKAALLGLALAVLIILGRNADSLLSASWSPLVTEKGKVLKILLVAGCFSLLLYGVHVFYRPFLGNQRLPRYALLLGLFGACVTILFLLPPFQGPDEIMHWKFALAYYRRDGIQDPAYKLPDQLRAENLPFQSDKHQDAALLRQAPPAGLQPKQPEDYVYVRWFSYPLVAAVALIYPRTDTTAEALQFYYLCRVVPAIVLLLLLLWACRRFHVPYTALMFFSLPLFLQQCCVVTSDSALHLGTLAAVLLFLHLWRNPSPALTVLLWALCVFITCSKFIVGGVLLLPLLLLPYRRIPHKRILVPLAVLAALVVVALLVPRFLASIRASPYFYTPEQTEAQIAALGSWEGWRTFIHLYLRMLKKLWGIDCWSYHMGWLDTQLSQLHLVLIRLCFVAAVLLDLCHFGPQLALVWKERKREAALVAGVIAANLFANTLSVALVYFILGVEPGGQIIAHWQARHFFPALTVLVLLPILLFDRGHEAAPGLVALSADSARARPRALSADSGTVQTALCAVALGVFPVLLFARNVELAIDLLTRYW